MPLISPPSLPLLLLLLSAAAGDQSDRRHGSSQAQNRNLAELPHPVPSCCRSGSQRDFSCTQPGLIYPRKRQVKHSLRQCQQLGALLGYGSAESAQALYLSDQLLQSLRNSGWMTAELGVHPLADQLRHQLRAEHGQVGLLRRVLVEVPPLAGRGAQVLRRHQAELLELLLDEEVVDVPRVRASGWPDEARIQDRIEVERVREVVEPAREARLRFASPRCPPCRSPAPSDTVLVRASKPSRLRSFV